MYRKIANIAKITNSTRIANRSKTFLRNFILAKICSIEIARRNLEKVCKNCILVTRNFIATKKHPDKYRKNNKATKRFTYKEKGIVRKFRKNRKTNKNILIF